MHQEIWKKRVVGWRTSNQLSFLSGYDKHTTHFQNLSYFNAIFTLFTHRFQPQVCVRMAGMVVVPRGTGCGGVCGGGENRTTTEEDANSSKQHQNHISILDLLIAALRKSMAACRVDLREESKSSALNQMEIGWPTDVQHLTHVTFDRFHGFLGLPVEFQVEIPCRVPSARWYIHSFFVRSIIFQ